MKPLPKPTVCLPPPDVLLRPCLLPAFSVEVYADYPDYVEQIRMAVEKCNYDLLAAGKIKPG
ncbi:MAG: Rz1-like lysis system protein LysC [Enterobacteriaceae bacterium]